MGSIDVHTHFVPRKWPDLIEKYGNHGFPWVNERSDGTAALMIGCDAFRLIDSSCWDADRRVEDMDRDSVATQVISTTPVLLSYHHELSAAIDIARFCNDAALEMAAQSHGRLLTMAQVPLQDTDAACAEVSRCMDDGHAGIIIGNHLGERYLDDPAMVTFLSHCASEGAAVLVHPWYIHESPALNRWAAPAIVGMVAETHLTIAALILTGAFDRLPEDLRICFSHGGGSFPFWLGRLQNGWSRLNGMGSKCRMSPVSYLDRFYVDSAVFDPRALHYLVEVLGDERIMLGTDYPYALGEANAGAVINASAFLSTEASEKIRRTNAIHFLGLQADA